VHVLGSNNNLADRLAGSVLPHCFLGRLPQEYTDFKVVIGICESTEKDE
jgi:hypothetical protein